MELNPTILYAVGILSGALFAAIACRNQQAAVLWGIGGAIYGLTLATIAVGIGHAAAVPYSAEVVSAHYWVSTAVSLALIALTAGVTVFVVRRLETKSPKPGK